MHIVFQHNSPLPVLAYGGIERMLYWHMKELVRLGHKVSLIGHPESQVEKDGIELIAMPKKAEDWHKLVPANADLIQLFYNYTAPLNNIPTVNTIGGNGKADEDFTLNTVFVSKQHALNHASDCFVYNALDLSEYPFVDRELNWENFFFLAKASWKVKNLKHCLKAARKNKKHLHILGGRTWWPSRYFHSHGMVGGDEKLKLISQSDALLFPVRWEEPFGLAMIEAMAMGLPVIGSNFGSLPELLEPHVGIVCKSYEEFEKALSNPTREFKAREIRNYVEENFSITHFSKAYLSLFEKVLNGENLNLKKPRWSRDFGANDLHPF